MDDYREQEPMAYKLETGYFYIQVCDSGYDYTCYDLAYKELDGGQLDNPELKIEVAASILIEEYFSGETFKEIDAYEMDDIVTYLKNLS